MDRWDTAGHVPETEDAYQILIGRLLLATKRRDDLQFNVALTEARTLVSDDAV